MQCRQMRWRAARCRAAASASRDNLGPRPDQVKHLPRQQLPCHHDPLHLVGALVDLGDLAVLPREVGQPGDGWLAADGGVGPVRI